MILRLRMQFVAISMILVSIILISILVFVHIASRNTLISTSESVLKRVIMESDLALEPEVYGHEVQMPFFTVSLFQQGSDYTAYVTGGTYDNLENTKTLQDIVTLCLQQEDTKGTIEAYNLRYLRQNTGFVHRIAFVDMSLEQAALSGLMRSYIQVGLVAMVGLLGVSWFLSAWAVRPVERAWRQQRQFLADASHELKTPLTVILSNAQLLDTLPMTNSGARWVDNIHYEAKEMKSLVEQMLTLARADQLETTPVLEEVSLWDVATDSVMLFEPVAFEAGKPLEEQLQSDVNVVGERDKLRQLIAILLDNAIKYGADGSPIVVTLTRTDRLAKLVVSNQGSVIPPAQLAHLFERFYRSDESRGEQTGFGLGLSIADTIATAHKATLRAESDATSTRFIFTIPLKRGG